MTYFVNDVSQGVCFSGLTGIELFPAVAFYGTTGTASILSVGVDLNGAGTESIVLTAVAPVVESQLVESVEVEQKQPETACTDFRFDTAVSSPSIAMVSPDQRQVCGVWSLYERT